MLLGIIAILAAMGAVTMIYSAQFENAEKGSEGLLCKTTLKLQEITSAGTDNIKAGPISANCKTIIKDLPVAAKNEYELTGEIATHVAKAWSITGEGENKALWDKGLFGSITGANKCVALYSLNMRENAKLSNYNITDKELEHYLLKEVYKELPDPYDNSITRPYKYQDYIQSYKGRGNIAIQKDLQIVPGEVVIISLLDPGYGAGELALEYLFGEPQNDDNGIVISDYDTAINTYHCEVIQ